MCVDGLITSDWRTIGEQIIWMICSVVWLLGMSVGCLIVRVHEVEQLIATSGPADKLMVYRSKMVRYNKNNPPSKKNDLQRTI